MDAAEPPRIVFESATTCSNRERAEALLRSTLATSRAPHGTWTVSIRIEPAAGGRVRAQGTISDDNGTALAHRELAETGTECRGLARAMGVWASLVLDVARDRAASPPDAAEVVAATAPPGQGGDIQAPEETGDGQPVGMAASASRTEAPALPPLAADAGQEKATDPDRAPTHSDERGGVELGAGAFLMTGTGGGPVVGATPFAFFEMAPGLFLRPSIGFGQSLGWLRVDTCVRAQGRYSSRHGLQLDMCGGADLVVYYALIVRPDAIGPSLALRGELGGDLAVAIRAVVGINAASHGGLGESDVDSSVWSARAELSLSWRLW